MSEESRLESLAGKLAILADSFLTRLPVKLAEIEEAIGHMLRSPADESRYDRLYRQFHTLAGSAGTFGFAELGNGARALEVRVATLLQEKTFEPDQAAALSFEARQLVAWCNDTRTEWKTAVRQVLPTRQRVEDRTRPVLVVDDDVLLAQDIALQLEYFGYRVAVVNALSELSAAVAKHYPCAVIMDMVFDEVGLAGATALVRIKLELGIQFPTIFISTSNQYDARLAAVRAGADGYFPKPIDMVSLSDRLDVLTARKEMIPYRILIMDDDLMTSEYYATVLRSASMEVQLLHDAREILDKLSDFQPDLVLMDVYMPECSGVELARLIRQDNKYLDMPIVFLSGETNYGKQISAIQSGADDFLEKPIEPQHLISAVTSRAERHRALRGLIMRDSLTLLYNHSAIKEQLGRELARARRSGKPLSLAMIDIDFFKKVNDTYGHPVGDQVIRVLARLLQQRLRRCDIVGRYGGEEFVVVFPNTSAVVAAEVLGKIRESFCKVKHHGDGRDFSSSFSAGVAEAGDRYDSEAMLKEADDMLYSSKKNGRNRITTSEQVSQLAAASQ